MNFTFRTAGYDIIYPFLCDEQGYMCAHGEL